VTDYALCTWRVRSAIELPETAPWRSPDRPVDIEIQTGSVPAETGRLAVEAPYLRMSADGSVIFDAMPHARFLVTANRVVVDLSHGPEDWGWRPILLGPVLAVVCYLRGLLPLHASAVRVRGRAVAFAGRSGAGKSTLAAALCDRGYPLVTDDISPVASITTEPLVHPTYPGLKLSDATLSALEVTQRDFTRIPLGDQKFQVPAVDAFDQGPLPLDRVYVIEDAVDESEDRVEAIGGSDAFQRLGAEIYRPEIGRFLFSRSTLFTLAAQLSSRISVRRLIRRPDFARLDALATLVEADMLRGDGHGDDCESSGAAPSRTAGTP